MVSNSQTAIITTPIHTKVEKHIMEGRIAYMAHSAPSQAQYLGHSVGITKSAFPHLSAVVYA